MDIPEFEELPDNMDKSPLYSIMIMNTGFKAFPKNFEKMKNLRSLSVINSKLTELPIRLSELPEVRDVEISGNEIAEFPKELAEKWQKVVSLRMNDTKLTSLPENIFGMKKVSTFDFCDNQGLSNLPKYRGDNTYMGGLFLDNCSFTSIPEIANTRMRTLSLANNKITSVSQEVVNGLSDQLLTLILDDNKINSFPQMASSSLIELSLDNCGLTAIPDLSKLPELCVLSLNSNQILEVKDGTFTNCTKFAILDLSKNTELRTFSMTRGTFTVTAVHPESGFTREQLLEDAALAERYSDHPISLSLQAACTSSLDAGRVSGVEEIAGHGVLAQVDGRRVAVGNRRLMERQGVSAAPCELPGTIVYVAVDGAYAGHIVISDLPKEDAKAAIADLKANGVKKTVMLTGDTEAAAKAVAAELGVDEYHAELLPADKVEWMERLLASSGGKTAFVGDGINDAPVLTRADIGIAMGALGSDAAIEAADIVLMDDKPSKIATAMRISRKTLRIAHQNIWFALIVKFAVMILGAFDLATMWEAVFADVGVAFIAILNATRCLKTEEFRS